MAALHFSGLLVDERGTLSIIRISGIKACL